MKKILYICKNNLEIDNADVNQITNLCNELTIQGLNITLVVPKLGFYKQSYNYKIKYLKTISIFKPIETITFQISLFFFMIRHIKDFDLIYCRLVPFLVIPYFIAKIKNKRIISELHGLLSEDIRLFQGYNKFIVHLSDVFEKKCLKQSSKIITVTPEIKNEIAKKYSLDEDKISVISNGFNEKLFKPMSKYECLDILKLNKQYKYIGCISTFAPWHDIRTLIKSLEIVLKEFADVKLILIGDGKSYNEMNELAKELKIEDKIIFSGMICHSEIPYYINSFDIAIAPFLSRESRINPGSPLKLYEYLACNTPVVITDCGSSSEFVRDLECGIVVKPFDEKSMSDSIVKLLKDHKLCEKLSNKGYEVMKQKFTWSKIAKNVIDVFNS